MDWYRFVLIIIFILYHVSGFQTGLNFYKTLSLNTKPQHHQRFSYNLVTFNEEKKDKKIHSNIY